MEKTKLEEMLENCLGRIGMPLGQRKYADDFDYQATCEDFFTEIKSTDSEQEKFIAFLRGKISLQQYRVGEQPLLERYSAIFNGLGFLYGVEGRYKGRTSLLVAMDELIKKRKFGEEYVEVYYSHDKKWQDIIYSNLNNQKILSFYENSNNSVLLVSSFKKKIIVDEYQQLEHSEMAKIMMKNLISSLEGSTSFDLYTIEKLLDKIIELKGALDKK